MNYESFGFSGTKSIDYRNARYQGLVSKDNKRQGFGIVLDDDMNLYCSEWSKGQLNGKTLILLRNGRYLYGSWQQGEPHGAICFKSKKINLYANYYKGKTKQTMVSFYEPTNNVLCFYAQEMEKKYGLQVISSQNLNNMQLYKQYMNDIVSKRCAILTNIDEITVLDFMRKIALKYQDFLMFKQKGQTYYFGFENGIGVRFTVSGEFNQHIHQISVGNHTSGEKLIQIGAKYYKQPECTQQGNFQTRQLISYNKYNQRPQQKCNLIFQNTHRKGLYFRNEYFDVKITLIASLQQFCSKKLIDKYEQIETEMKQSVKSSQLKRNESNLLIESQNGRRKSELLKQKSTQNLILNSQKSTKNLVAAQDKYKPSYLKRNTYTQQNAAVNQLIKNYNDLRYKNPYHCHRSPSKTVSQNKSTNKLSKLKQKSKDVHKEGRQQKYDVSPLKKQIKYLKHKVVQKSKQKEASPLKHTENAVKNKELANSMKYNRLDDRPLNKSSNQRDQQKSPYRQQKNRQQKPKEEKYRQQREVKNTQQPQNSIKNQQKKENKGSSFVMDDMLGIQAKQQNKLSQYQIELKIRQQLLQQEKYRDIKNRQMSQFIYQRQLPSIRLQSMNDPLPRQRQPINSPLPRQRQSYVQRQSQYVYDEVTLSPKEIKHLIVPEVSPRRPLELKTATPNFDSYLQNLQGKRQKLLREFRQMTEQMQSNLMPSRYIPLEIENSLHLDRLRSFESPIRTNSIYTEYQSPLENYHEQQNLRMKQEIMDLKLANHIYKNSESLGSVYRAERLPLQNTINSLHFNDYVQSVPKEFSRKKKYEYLLQ